MNSPNLIGIDVLNLFCDSTNEKFDKPRHFNGHVYASNGHIAVRVFDHRVVGPVEPMNPEQGEKVFALFSRVFDTTQVISKDPKTTLLPDKASAPPMTRCPTCGGSGAVSFCPECDNKGVVEFSNDHSEYECVCQTCEGDGVRPEAKGNGHPCTTCCGNGFMMQRFAFEEFKGFALNGDSVKIAWRLLMMMHALTNVVISSPKNHLAPIPFTFTEGIGIVMPMR